MGLFDKFGINVRIVSKEELIEERKEAIRDMVDTAAECLISIRRTAHLDGTMEYEEFDEMLNEISDKYNAIYSDATLDEIAARTDLKAKEMRR